MSTQNLIWLVVIVVAGVIAYVASGWKVALIVVAVGLVISEIVQRSIRRSRRAG